MKLKFSVPLLSRATPPKTKGVREVYVAHSVTIDVPVISRANTHVAMEVYEAIDRNNGYSDSGAVELVESVHNRLVQLRTFEGQLYRKISDDIRADQNKSHQVCFPMTIGAPLIDDSLYITGEESDVKNYISADLVRQHDWDLVKQSGSDSKILTAWPTQYGGLLRRFDARNETYWDDIVSRLDNIDYDTVEKSVNMIDLQLDKLIIIDDELWIKCLPPAWCVEVKPDYFNPDTASSYHVLLSLKILPDGFDPELSRRYFSLNQLQDALAFHRYLSNFGSGNKGTYLPSKLIPDHMVIDPQIVEFEVDEYELRRFNYALTTEINRQLNKNPAQYDSLDPVLQEFIQRQISELHNANYVTQVHPEVGDQLEDLVAVWIKLNRPMNYCNMAPERLKIASRWISDMKEASSNRFVTLETAGVKSQLSGKK